MLGKLGCWVENIERCSVADWKELIDRAKTAGFSWLLINAGNQYLNSQFIRLLDSDAIDYAHQNDIQILSYNVSKPETWAAEVSTISFLLERVDGHIVCLSDRWMGKTATAQQFMRLLRKRTTGFCGYSVPVEKAPHFPLEVFESNLDVSMPLLTSNLEASLGSLDKVTERLKSSDRLPTFPAMQPMVTTEMSKAFTIFEGIPFSINSWDQVQKDDNSMLFGWLTSLNQAGMISLEVAEDFEVTEPEINEDSGIISEQESDPAEETDPTT